MSWRHDRFLKGTLAALAARADSASVSQGPVRLFLPSRQRETHRLRPSVLSAEELEEHVLKHWAGRKLTAELADLARVQALEEIAERRKRDQHLLDSQKRRLQRLEAKRRKLIDAYLAEAIPIADLKQRQKALGAEQRDAERLLDLASVNSELAEHRLEIALRLV